MKKTLTDALLMQAKGKAKEYIIWDKKLAGFAVRVKPTGTKTFIVMRRVDGKLKRHTMARCETLSLEAARLQAAAVLSGHELVIDKPETPLKPKTSLRYADFVKKHFWPWACTKWKQGSIDCSKSYMNSQLLPYFGKMRLNEINKMAVLKWFETYSQQSPGGANRAIEVLAGSFAKANEWELMKGHPAKEIIKNPKRKMVRFLSRDEIKRLGKVLDEMEAQRGGTIKQANIIRLLLLTGCRHREISALKWEYIEGDIIHLPDSKTGARDIFLSREAKAILDRIASKRHEAPKDRQDWVFWGKAANQPIAPIWPFWSEVCEKMGISGVRIHDLRHTFASQAALQGHSLMEIKKMLGHKQLEMTLHYVHIADPEAYKAAVFMADLLADMLEGKGRTPKPRKAAPLAADPLRSKPKEKATPEKPSRPILKRRLIPPQKKIEDYF